MIIGCRGAKAAKVFGEIGQVAARWMTELSFALIKVGCGHEKAAGSRFSVRIVTCRAVEANLVHFAVALGGYATCYPECLRW